MKDQSKMPNKAIGKAWTLKLALAWLTIAFLFALYGYLVEGRTEQTGLKEEFYLHLALQGIVTWAVSGIWIATYLIVGIVVVLKVRGECVKRVSAVLIMLAFLLLGPLLTLATFFCAGEFLPWEILRGEEGRVIFIQTVLASAVHLCLFVLFCVAIFRARPQLHNHDIP